MKPVRVALFSIAVFQILSTLLGAFQLFFFPGLYESTLRPTVFAGQFVLAGLMLGGVVGGAQCAAVYVHRRHSAWLHTGHAVAGFVMIGWIAAECLALNSFIWPHALWGGLGAVQIALVLTLLGVLRRQ